MASYEYKSLNLKDYINQLYNDGLKKSVYLTENEIEDLIYYCLDKNINILILFFKLIENNNKYINKSISKAELLNKILNSMEK